MRLIIEARLEDARIGAAPAATTIVEVVERQDGSLANLGLTLAEGRALLAKVQSVLVSQQTAGWMASQVACQDCGSVLAHKDSRFIVMRTVFGKVKVLSPRLWACSCAGKQQGPRRSLSPLCKARPQRVTPELQYLQAKRAAHLHYQQATALLQEVLPLDNAISLGCTRRRILAVGDAVDAQIERDIAAHPKSIVGGQVRESTSIGCVSVDSAWLSFSSSPKSRKAARELATLKSLLAIKLEQARHVNIVAGRATFTNRTSRLYAYVHNQVHSAAARLDQFLTSSGMSPDERVTVISDDAGEFGKAVQVSRLIRGSILGLVSHRNEVQGHRQLNLRQCDDRAAGARSHPNRDRSREVAGVARQRPKIGGSSQGVGCVTVVSPSPPSTIRWSAIEWRRTSKCGGLMKAHTVWRRSESRISTANSPCSGLPDWPRCLPRTHRTRARLHDSWARPPTVWFTLHHDSRAGFSASSGMTERSAARRAATDAPAIPEHTTMTSARSI